MQNRTLPNERYSFGYLESTIPVGMPVAEYRRSRPAQASSALRRFVKVVRPNG